MKKVILILSLIWVMGCSTDERTPIRQAFDDGLVSEIALAKVEQGICGSGCDPSDPHAYAQCIAAECGGAGPGNGGGDSGGGGYACYEGQEVCGSYSCEQCPYSTGGTGWLVKNCSRAVICDGGASWFRNDTRRLWAPGTCGQACASPISPH